MRNSENKEENKGKDNLPNYVIMDSISKRYLVYIPTTDSYKLKIELNKLKIWDYYWDKECMPISENYKKDFEGVYLVFKKLNEEELDLLNEKIASQLFYIY